MNITYQLTQDEYIQAVKLHHTKGRRFLMLTAYAGLAIIIVIIGTDFSNIREIITNVLTAFFSISFYILFVRIISAYQAKSVYTKSTILQDEITVRVSRKGIKLDKKRNNLTIPWSAFSKWKKDEHFYLLYTNPRHFNAIPAKAMRATETKELEVYLEKYISKTSII